MSGSIAADSVLSALALSIVGGVAGSQLFVIAHDACHGSYTSSRTLNAIIGRLAFVPSVHSYSLWAYFHNGLHHNFTNLRGPMSFNWRLLLAPEEVLDYVVWHEACHLAYSTTRRRFWSLLAAPPPRLPRAAAVAAAPRARRSCCDARVAVVGHVEWVDFAVVAAVPRTGRDPPRARAFSRRPAAAERWRPSRSRGSPASARFLHRLGDDADGRAAARLAGRDGRRRSTRPSGASRSGACFTFLDDAARAHDHRARRAPRPARRRRPALGATSPTRRASTSPAATPRRCAHAARASWLVADAARAPTR